MNLATSTPIQTSFNPLTLLNILSTIKPSDPEITNVDAVSKDRNKNNTPTNFYFIVKLERITQERFSSLVLKLAPAPQPRMNQIVSRFPAILPLTNEQKQEKVRTTKMKLCI